MAAANPEPTAESELYDALQRAAERLRRELGELLRPHGLSPAQWEVLIALADDAALGGSALADRRAAGAPDMSRLLARLGDAGLIERHPSPDDRRVRLARLTPAGQALVAQLTPAVADLHARQFEHLGNKKTKRLLKRLGELAG